MPEPGAAVPEPGLATPEPGAAVPDRATPPPTFANIRAGKTRVSFATRRSPARSREGSSWKRWWRIAPVARLRKRRREASRVGAGCCAIRSLGIA